MPKSLAELKKARGSAVSSLQKSVEKLDKKWENDERFWQPTADKAGTGSAVIRFLPATKDEELPWVRTWSHSFQGPTGKWYIENSRTTIEQPDPVSELNSELWNSGDTGKEIARKQKRKLNYISNILVIKDSANPQNEGKVFLYKYGKKIFDKIKDAMNPPEGFEDEKEMNPFDFWDGANFKLKFAKVDGYRNYDKSAFTDPSPISSSDAQIEKLWESCNSLEAFIAADQFKAYDELKKKLDFVLKGGPVGTSSRTEEESEEVIPKRKAVASTPADEDDEEIAPPKKSAKAKAAAVEVDEEEEKPKKGAKAGKPKAKAKAAPDDDDDVLAHFQSLADED